VDPLLNSAESSQRLEVLLLQICKATEHSTRVVVHGDFNLDLDRWNNGEHYIGAMLKSLADCTTSLPWRQITPAQPSDCLAAFVILLEEVTALLPETSYVRRETPQVRPETACNPQKVG
jgi:hypothetical protein